MFGVAAKHWRADEDVDVMVDALRELQRRAQRRGVPVVIRRDLCDGLLAWLMSPSIRSRTMRTIGAWVNQQAIPRTGWVPMIVVPAAYVDVVLLACMTRGTPRRLQDWAAEQADELGIDELSRERIQRAMACARSAGSAVRAEAKP